MAFPIDRRKRRSLASGSRPVLAALALLFAALRADATPLARGVTAVLAVTASVPANCTIRTNPVHPGSHDARGANAPLSTTGTVSLACTKGSTASITFDLERNPTGKRRDIALAGGDSGASDLLYYELDQLPRANPDAACPFPVRVTWTASPTQTFAPSVTPDRALRTYNLFGPIPARQVVRVGSHADIVFATVNF